MGSDLGLTALIKESSDAYFRVRGGPTAIRLREASDWVARFGFLIGTLPASRTTNKYGSDRIERF